MQHRSAHRVGRLLYWCCILSVSLLDSRWLIDWIRSLSAVLWTRIEWTTNAFFRSLVFPLNWSCRYFPVARVSAVLFLMGDRSSWRRSPNLSPSQISRDIHWHSPFSLHSGYTIAPGSIDRVSFRRDELEEKKKRKKSSHRPANQLTRSKCFHFQFDFMRQGLQVDDVLAQSFRLRMQLIRGELAVANRGLTESELLKDRLAREVTDQFNETGEGQRHEHQVGAIAIDRRVTNGVIRVDRDAVLLSCSSARFANEKCHVLPDLENTHEAVTNEIESVTPRRSSSASARLKFGWYHCCCSSSWSQVGRGNGLPSRKWIGRFGLEVMTDRSYVW